MKNIYKSVAIVIVALALSGCVKTQTDITINKNKSMDFETEYLVNNKLEGSFFTEEEKKNIKSNGYTITDITKDDYRGLKITKKFKNIDKISNKSVSSVVLEEFIKNDTKLFKVEKSLFKNKYTAKLDVSFLGEKETEDKKSTKEYTKEELFELSALAQEELEMIYTVNLPYESLSNNSNLVKNDGKTLQWKFKASDLINQSSQKLFVEFEFELINYTFIYIICIVGGLLIACGVVFYIMFRKKSKNKKKK